MPRSVALDRWTSSQRRRKKTTATVCEKASSQLELQLQRIFADRRHTGQLDLEDAEMAIRSTVHQTGADAITALLRFSLPDHNHRSIPFFVVMWLDMKECVPGRYSLRWVGLVLSGPTTFVPPATADSFRPTLSSTLTKRTSPRRYGACSPWSEERRPSRKAETR
jgi:hypothetical protein